MHSPSGAPNGRAIAPAAPPCRAAREACQVERTRLALQEPYELAAAQQGHAVLCRERDSVFGHIACSDVDAVVRLAPAPRGIELAQRLDSGPGDLPALAAHQGHAPGFGQLEVGVPAVEAAHRVTLLPEGRLHRAGEFLPGPGAERFEPLRDFRGA